MRIVVRLAPVAGAVLLAATMVAPVQASDHPPLSTWPVMLRSGPIDLAHNDGPSDDPGHWVARNVRLGDGHLRFTLDVTPVPVHLAVRSGPAVLFVSVGASGGSGDVGYQQVLRVDAHTAPACRRDPCRYRFEVDADLTDLPAMVAAADIDPFVMADVGLTFARTFGDGTWIQVLDGFRVKGRESFRDGRPLTGTIYTTGLAPVGAAEGWSRQQPGSTIDLARRMDRLTAGLHDPSRALPTVRVRLAMEAPGCWPYLRAAIHDDQATRPFDAPLVELDPAGTVVEVPDDTTWTVTLSESGMVDGDQYGNVRIRAGTFTTNGQDLDLLARFPCENGTSAADASLTVTPAAVPLPAPSALRRGAWTTAYDRGTHRRRAQPFTVAAQDGRFIALDWDPDPGWTELTSRDGRTWAIHAIPAAAGLPEPTEELDPRLWSVGDGVRLTAVVFDASGASELRTWLRTGPGQWVMDAPVSTGAGAEVGALAEHAGVELLLAGPDGSLTDTALLRSVDGGDRSPVAGPAGDVVALTGTADGFAAVARVTDPAGTVDTLVTSADGLAWSSPGTLPTGSMSSPALTVVDGQLFLAASDQATGMTRGWRQADDRSWEPVLLTVGTLLDHGLAASGRTVAILTSVGGDDAFGAGAVSTDAGRTWDRGEALDTVGDMCPLSVGVAGTTVVAGTGTCHPSAVATRWHELPRANR